MTAALDTDPAPVTAGLPGLDSDAGGGMLEGKCDTTQFDCHLPAGHKGRHRMAPGTTRADKRRAAQAARPKTPGRPRTSSAAPRPRGAPKKAAPSVMPGLLGMAWAAIGYRIEQNAPEPAGPPVGRVMQFQYLDAGATLHRVLMAAPLYRRIVAVAGAGGGISDDLAALLAGPVLAAVMATNDAAKIMLWPVFAEQIKASAVSIAEAQAEQVAAMEAVGEYETQVSEMLEHMQEGLFAPRPPAEDEAEAAADG
jgi:hypothetical protein